METFLIVAVVAIVLFFFMKGLFSFKNGVQLSIRPFNEWMILAKSASKKELEVMCHSVLLETGSMLEKANVISQKEFRDLFLNSRVYASDFIMLTLITVDIQEQLSKPTSFPLYESEEARFYLYKCFCRCLCTLKT
ncbi:hypothetical protein ACFODO_12175 [Acinetobacter sichuanensis]|uniref:Uncharacterized protein n=3 Tax=Acinetobacter TaxID=469 RepID=A0ABV7BIF6_9GAMM|nr:hypothetical protein [Acinetobacter bereziniae]MDC4441674.1 hypothetical protein [Acinetobacter baumannii]